MQLDNYSAETFRTKSSSSNIPSAQMNFISQSQSPPVLAKQFSNKMFETEPLPNGQFSQNLLKKNSFTKLRPDSSSFQSNQAQGQYSSYQATSKPLYESKDKDSSNFAAKKPTQDFSSYSFQKSQSNIDKSLEYTLQKIENQSLKSQNTKLKETETKLRKELEEKVSTLKKFNQLMKIKYYQLKGVKQQLTQKQAIIQTLQQQKENYITLEQATRLKELLIRKSKDLDDINNKIHNLEHENFKNEVFQMKINTLHDQLEQEKSKTNQFMLENSTLSQKLREMEEQIEVLEFQNQKSIAISKVAQIQQIENIFKSHEMSPSKAKQQSTHLTAFEEALRVQMKQIQELKHVIENSSQVVTKLRENLITSRRQLEELRNEMKILDFKATSQRKKLIMEYRLQIHEKDNEINTAFKKYKTLDEKYKNALLDIKAKDDFFRQHLVGRVTETTVQQYIDSILNKYTQNFDEIITLKSQNGSLKEKLQKYNKYEEEIQNLDQQLKIDDQ